MLTFFTHGGDRISPLNYFDRLQRRRGRTYDSTANWEVVPTQVWGPWGSSDA